MAKFPVQLGGPIYTEYINDAINQLAIENPRIIVVLSTYKATMACFLYEHGLYGPDFVIFLPGESYFTVDDNTRMPNCKSNIVEEVLKSSFFFADGTDFAVGKPIPDSFGLKPAEYEGYLKSKMDRPEDQWDWLMWRRFCYSPVEVIGYVLQNIDERLQQHNDTIGNWSVSGENFQQNASFIENIIKEEFRSFKYEGEELNTLLGSGGIYQMQKDTPDSRIRPVAVASYDPHEDKYETLAPVKWRTVDGQAPFDRIQYIHYQKLLVPKTTSIIIIGKPIIFIKKTIVTIIYFLQ